MFSRQRTFKLGWAITGLAFFACSNDPSDNGLPPSNTAGASDVEQEAGASSGGNAGAGPSGSAAAGAGAPSNEGGRGSTGPNDAQGGDESAEGGAENQGGSDGSPAGEPGRVSVLGPPSADCEASDPVDLSVPRAPGLSLPPSIGQVCDDTGEPNDLESQACQLALGAAVETRLTKEDPVDHFVYHAEAGVTYALRVSAVKCVRHSSLDAVRFTATSLASAGNTPQLSALTYFGEQDSFDIPASSKTGDRLLEFTANQPCEYELTLFPSTAQGLAHGADYEPNDTPRMAASVTLNQRVSSRLSNPGDRRDYFTVPVQANVTYSIGVSTEGCLGVSSLDVMTVRGESVSVNDAVENLKLDAALGEVHSAEFTPKMSGEERISFSLPRSCEYEFYVIPSTICGLGHDSVSHEPNDTPSTAAPLPLGHEVRAELRANDSADYYGIEVEPYGQYTLELEPIQCAGVSSLDTFRAQVWSGRAKEVNKGSKNFSLKGGRETFAFTAGSSPHHLVLIEGNQSCEYALVVTQD